MRTITAVAILGATAFLGPAAPTPDPLMTMVEAERAFAAQSVKQGMRAAFVAYMAPDCTLYRPRPEPGFVWIEQWAGSPVELFWDPVVGEMSRAGDLGYTSGPWSFKPKAGDPPAAEGQYCSVWKRQADGTLKVLVDHGTEHPPGAATERWEPREPEPVWRAPKGGSFDPKKEWEVVLALDAEPHPRAERFTADARLLIDGRPLARTAAERAAWLTLEPATAWRAERGEVASSGDLAYSAGAFTRAAAAGHAAEEGTYLRLWRRSPDGGWKISLELMALLPPPDAPAKP